MSIEIPQKFGLDQMKKSPELELRLRKIELSLAQKARANNENSEVRILSPTLVPGPPSGLTLQSAIGTIGVKWNAVPIGNLREYEVQIDTNDVFSSPSIFRTTLINHNFVGLTSNTQHFVRLRAVTTGGITGEFSGTLDTTTGLVQTADIADGGVQIESLESGGAGASAVAFDDTDQTVGNTEVDLISLSITPTDATSMMVIMWSVAMNDDANNTATARITNTADTDIWNENLLGRDARSPDFRADTTQGGVATDAPGSISSQTYTLKWVMSTASTETIHEVGMFIYEVLS